MRSLLSDEDQEVRAEAKGELTALQEGLSSLEQGLMIDLLPVDADDGRDILLEIRPGPGGDEAALFGADLFKMYSHFAGALQGFRLQI